MMRGMFSAISGLQVSQTMLDVAANDIANVNTVGFKGQTTSFKDTLYQLQRGASAPSASIGGTNPMQIGLGVQLGAIESQMSAGAIQQTGNPLDLAIQGDGFFRVGTGNVIGSGSGYSYTRAGNFTLDSGGNLVTQDGEFVIGYKPGTTPGNYTPANETKLTVPAGAKDVSIGSDGTVTYVDATNTVQTLGQISLAKFANPGGLERISGNLFAVTTNSGPESTAVPGDATTGMGTLAAGAVEMSNVDLAQEFTTMITAQRAYEANSRVISTADQMLQTLVNLGRG
jgi:flagellar hook protein FlgE